MNREQLVMLLPLLILAATPVVLLLVLAFHRDHRMTVGLTLFGLLMTLIGLAAVVPHAPRQVTPLIVIDRFAIFYIALFVLAAAAVALLAYGYLKHQDERPCEFYVLLLLATLGCAVLAASTHFASFFLGLETLSVSLYAMIAYTRGRERCIEAALKYLVLAGSSSAFLLFGMALVYAALGTMQLEEIARAATAAGAGVWLLSGIGMIIIGIGFKLAVVPFHMWTPDVYEGAPAPVAAFIATVSKGAVFALVLRYFGRLGMQGYSSLLFLFALIAIASMFVGNLLALLQDNLKRLLAYSSIAHLGYLLVAFLAGRSLAVEAATFYLVAYFVTTLAAFGVITALSSHWRDRDELEEYRGLFWRRPWLAGILAASLLSLAGIPLTAGFVGKFYILLAGARGTLWSLLIMLVVSSVIGLFYYLRVIVAMVDRVPKRLEEAPLPTAGSWSVAGGATLFVLISLLLLLGVYPGPLITWVREATSTLPF